MNIETASVWASLAGVALVMCATVAQVASGLSSQDLSYLTSILNSAGLGLMSFGAGGILYVITHGG
jgi:hypothetical protein